MTFFDDEIDLEIEEDRRKFFSSQTKFLKEDSIFLNEEDKPDIKHIDDVKKNNEVKEDKTSALDNSKQAIGNLANDAKENVLGIIQKFKNIIQEVNNESVKEEEQRVLDNDIKLTSEVFNFMTKFAICSVLIPIPGLNVIAAIIAYYVHSKKIKKEARMKFYIKLKSDYALLNSKIRDLEYKDHLTKTETEQKYKLIKLREMTKMNMHKLEYMVKESEDKELA